MSNTLKKTKDKKATIQQYLKRMQKCLDKNPDFLKALDDRYLTSYDVYTTTTKIRLVDPIKFETEQPFALMRFAQQNGISILGIISERKKGGNYICSEREKYSDKCVYIGRYNYFGKQLETSPFAILSCDSVYEHSE